MGVNRLFFCGAREYSGLSYGDHRISVKFREMLAQLSADRNGAPYRYRDTVYPGFVVFTAAGSILGLTKGNYGEKLAKYIEKEKLGKVTKTPVKTNPNTGNKTRMYIWAVNHTATKKWYNSRKG